MSGGHFDYQQYHIGDIADNIENVIMEEERPRPPVTKTKGVAVYDMSEDGTCCSWCYRYNFNSFDEARKYFKSSRQYEIIEEKALSNGEREMSVRDKHYSQLMKVRSYTDEKYLDEDGEEIFYRDLSKETLEELRKAVKLLRRAQVYAQRIDWLLSGDDGEETFHEQLKEDLEKLNDI